MNMCSSDWDKPANKVKFLLIDLPEKHTDGIGMSEDV